MIDSNAARLAERGASVFQALAELIRRAGLRRDRVSFTSSPEGITIVLTRRQPDETSSQSEAPRGGAQ
jgi:hypothetical protein